MIEQILLAVFSFGLGISTTLITQLILRRFGFDNAKRKLILNHLNRIRERLDDYEKLFKCEYPELSEFVFAYDSLNPQAPYYSDENPIKVYEALVQYQSIRKIIDDKERLTDEALNFLESNRVIRRGKFKENAIDAAIHLQIFTWNKSDSIFEKLRILNLCDVAIFSIFPKKVATSIEWDRLGIIKPQDVRQIIRTRLKPRYNDKGKHSDEIDSAESTKEADLSDARENLGTYRNQAFLVIREIGQELSKLEQKWAIPV